ncbi:hypothetical protein [Mesorhizobium qingshengii]|uniref:Uncharacterized protein n=1 Tax=Mesorhizobium qingshengii TaxID=1165689 RepID=A0A1G5V3B3_9HYPH|nr:hypothetical protein [Mesorhizobium qingshengii]SDA39495.1 hypothetical protein SAMN02927914_00152 [Mesorhizobium qingshengii]
MSPFLVLGIGGTIAWAIVLYGVHRLYSAHFQRRAAAGAAFRRRVNKHVMRGGIWS